MASLTFKGGSYYGVFSKAGKKKWLKIGRVDKKEAKKILKQLELDYSKDRLNLSSPLVPTLYQYLNKYFVYSKTNKAHSTYTIELEITKTIKKYFGDIELSKIDSISIENYKSHRKSLGLKPATINKELSLLRFMLNKALEWKYIDKTPKLKLLRLPKEPVKYLNTIEINKILDNCSEWLKPMVIVMLNTGMRIGETLNLRFKDIDYDNRKIMVRSSKTNNFRVIPMNEELFRILRWLKLNYVNFKNQKVTLRQPQQREYLFCHSNGNKLKTIKNSFGVACRKAGVKASLHSLRHTFASHLVMSGIDLVTVKELLGHSSISTTMIYSHISEEHKVRSIEKLKLN
ncbi:MAG TPA: tyrosine-type recombinase/integrase [Thermodesulfobacteriota bacterium]|nr:tyrosine-type recombinase/integrase [Thermodesulfobacteriota bacterium]